MTRGVSSAATYYPPAGAAQVRAARCSCLGGKLLGGKSLGGKWLGGKWLGGKLLGGKLTVVGKPVSSAAK
jgi:hypothetical protein